MEGLISTKDLAKKYGLMAKKSLGQNFLFDHKITDKIASKAGEIEGENILEIGPGPGGLTKSILKQNPKKLIVIEQDERVTPLLEEIKSFYPQNLEIINGDALRIDVNKLFAGESFKIIANLPYNIGTELVFRWMENMKNIESMTLLLQKEVVQRIVSDKGSKKYGRLSVMINFFCETKSLFDIAPGSFVPAPKVTSTLVNIKPRLKPILDVELKILSRVCAAAFSQRRKMLRSSLKSLLKPLEINVEDFLGECGIDSSLRAEQLSLEEFGKMANYLKIK
jgi:16S rRNA (adenine1518-N6/adenine1519-N6)-dimethyltransferase